MPAKTLRHHARIDALACRINRRRRTCGATADHQNIKRCFGIELFCRFFTRARIEFGDDFLKGHTPLTKLLTIEKHDRYGHDVARFDLVLKVCAINHRMADVGIEYRH